MTVNIFTHVGVPYIEVMIAMMVQLMDTSGAIVLFETIGGPPKSNHMQRELFSSLHLILSVLIKVPLAL